MEHLGTFPTDHGCVLISNSGRREGAGEVCRRPQCGRDPSQLAVLVVVGCESVPLECSCTSASFSGELSSCTLWWV